VGVGITMTLPMDIRIAAKGARMGFIFARRGLVPEAGSAWFFAETRWSAAGIALVLIRPNVRCG